MGDVVFLSLTAAFNPTLVAASTLMMLLPNAARLMAGYLLGALMTSITLGIVIVFSFSDSSAATTTENTISPAVDIALGGLALLLAAALSSGHADRLAEGRRERKEAKGRDKGPPRWQRAMSKGSPRITFVIGALLTLPGASYLAGLHRIHELGYSNAETIALVVAFNIVMLVLLEIPLCCFVVAPHWTPVAIERAKTWISRRARRFAVRGLAVVGTLLIIKGLVGLIA